MNPAAPRAILIEDEALPRQRLREGLALLWPQLQVLAEAEDGEQGLALALQHRPDIVFVDIRMPGLDGLQLAQRIKGQAHIVFVTAYDQYAIDAFEHGAMDYLLKPVTAERIAMTRERLKPRLAKAPDNIGTQLAELTALLKKGPEEKKSYLKWIQAQVGNSLRMISTKEILFFQADEKYTRVQTPHAELLIRKTLKELSDELDPDEFWRIHRSTLVRVDAISEVVRDDRGRHMVVMKGHPEKLEISRGHTHLFQQM
jgi:DNA-binding LytR/AlgR family response regulator